LSEIEFFGIENIKFLRVVKFCQTPRCALAELHNSTGWETVLYRHRPDKHYEPTTKANNELRHFALFQLANWLLSWKKLSTLQGTGQKKSKETTCWID